MNVFDMTKEDFEKVLGRGGWSRDIGEFNALVIIPLDYAHRQRTDSYTTYLAHGGKGDPAEEVGLDALAMAISALEKTKWISVKDKLPEEDGDYLVAINYFGNHQSINVRSFAKAGETVNEYDLVGEKNVWYRYDSEYGYISTDSVTHWMPLPEPPKGETNNA